MNSAVSSLFDDMSYLNGLSDSSSSGSVTSVDLHVGFGDHRMFVEEGWNAGGKDFAQSCPTVPSLLPLQANAGGSPCPCDRWCESSATCDSKTGSVCF